MPTSQLRVSNPQLHKMDNKTSHDVKTCIRKENTRLQYIPPDITTPIWQNRKFVHGNVTSSLALLGFQKPSQSQIGVASSTNVTTPSTCSDFAARICLSWHSRPWRDPFV
jgi:hypothetical protein